MRNFRERLLYKKHIKLFFSAISLRSTMKKYCANTRYPSSSKVSACSEIEQ